MKDEDIRLPEQLLSYFRCPELPVSLTTSSALGTRPGYFRLGDRIVGFGRTATGHVTDSVNADLYDLSSGVVVRDSEVILPFDSQEVISNLLRERYAAKFDHDTGALQKVVRAIYYFLRPYLGLSLRAHLQRLHLRNWQDIPFPSWPVDLTVDRLQRELLALTMRAAHVDSIPFIWFWPDQFESCAILTHDVEHEPGKQFCTRLMDIDDSFGLKSSFQIVPEDRYPVEPAFLRGIRERGFEINVHDLKHDGRLFEDRAEFQTRAQQINRYAHEFGAEGFRSGALYRNPDWYDALAFSYDMSIPNVGHLDPQHGGCCTIMPYFVGDMVELPLTCAQDHTLFNILNDYSLSLWKRQIRLINDNHGLITILTHPDYLLTDRAQSAYRELLQHLSMLRDTGGVWTPLPRDVASWWRQRSKMRLVLKDGSWSIEGEGKERACIAYAQLHDGKLEYLLEKPEKAALPRLHDKIPSKYVEPRIHTQTSR